MHMKIPAKIHAIIKIPIIDVTKPINKSRPVKSELEVVVVFVGFVFVAFCKEVVIFGVGIIVVEVVVVGSELNT